MNKATRRSTLRWFGLVSGLWLAAVSAAPAANQWFDSGATTGMDPASGAVTNVTWGVDNLWVPSNASATPGAWTNGNNAFFTAAGTATVTVNSVTANFLNFSAGTWVFRPGTGPLTINGGITNSQNVLFGNNLTLGADQTWYLSANSTTVTGAMSAASYTLTKTGTGALVLSNAANQFAGLVLNAGTVNAFNNSLGGSSANLTLGDANQAVLSTLRLDTVAAGNNTFNIGNLTVAGSSRLILTNSVAGSTVILSGATLGRSGRGTLIISPTNNATLGGTSQLLFTGGTNPTAGGILAPWLVTVAPGGVYDFVSNGPTGLTTNGVYQTGAWTSTKVVAGSGTLNINTNAHALKLTGATTVNSDVTLTLGDGTYAGLLLNGNNLLGGGTVAVSTAELIIHTTGAATIAPVLSGSGGLTLNAMSAAGAGVAVTLSNMTYTGNTWIQNGTLVVAPTGTTTYAGTINGVGTLDTGGSGALVLTGNSVFNGSVNLTGGKLTFNGNSWTNYTAGRINGTGIQMVITNGAKVQIPLNAAGNSVQGTSNTLTVVGSGVPGVISVLDVAGQQLNIGSTTGSVVRVDGNGVVGGAVITNTGMYVGSSGGFSNGLVIANGGRVFASFIVVREYLNVGSSGVVSRLTLGTGSGALQMGDGSGQTPSLTVTNAEIFGRLRFGSNVSSNRVTVLADTVWNFGGGDFDYNTASAGVTGNVVVVNGGVLTNISNIFFGLSGPQVDGSLTVSNGGKLFTIGQVKVGNVANSSGNAYNVGGLGLSSFVSNGGAITVGNTGAGFNRMTVTNATLQSGAATIGNGSSNNTATVQAGGYWNTLGNSVTVGSGAATGNVVWVQSGGILEANSLITGAGAGNVITNSGGVYQFSTATPTVTLGAGAGSVAINNGTISFRAINNANVSNSLIGGSSIGNISFSGANTLMFNGASNTAATANSQNYTFNIVAGNPSNYAGMAMVNGHTAYGQGNITIGNAGSMLVSNTIATISGLFTNAGALSVVNAQATFQSRVYNSGTNTMLNSSATFNGGVVNAGSWLTDPTTNIFQNFGLTNTSSGVISMAAGDVYIFSNTQLGVAANFINVSTNNVANDLSAGKFLFSGGLGLTQTLTVAGHDLGPWPGSPLGTATNELGGHIPDYNFALGTLEISNFSTVRVDDAFLGLSGLGTNDNLMAGLYLENLLMAPSSYLIIGTNVQVYFVNSNNWTSANYLLEGNATLNNSINGLHQLIPEPSLLLLCAAGTSLLVWLRRHRRS